MYNLSDTENQIFIELIEKDLKNKSSGKSAALNFIELFDTAAADETLDGEFDGISGRINIKRRIDI